MPSRQLGSSSVHVSPVIFGAWAIGGWMWGGSDEADAIRAIHASLDAGVNTIDTAAIYGMGHSEEIVGRAIAGKRDQYVIATKCGMRWNSDEGTDPWPQKDNAGKDVVVRKNAKKDSILYECEQSLKRLNIDVIDLYQIHWPDTSTPVEESLEAMSQLHKQGKIRAIGVSNYDVEWLTRASKVAPLASLQPPYSLIQRNIEATILPWCRQNNVGVIVYSPLERGLLTGKVTPDRKFEEGDHRSRHKFFTPENRQRVLDALKPLQPIADQHKATLAQLTIAWTIAQPGITAALVGARDADQAKQNAAAMTLKLSADELAAIRKAFDEPSRVMTA
ncbi:MAG TPA: aldo/keto reductase [Tepidisphaeraceae bacterium]|jgi:aryl-alcohol dehydrogenase-like predicted oxidoreductase